MTAPLSRLWPPGAREVARPMSLLDHHDPESWRFYRYGVNEAGEPLFSFWMNINDSTGVCIYDRSGGHGMWLSTHHDDEYEAQPPSDELKAVLREVVGSDGYVEGDRVNALPDHERYFFQAIYGTINQKGHAPEELLRFIEHVVGSEVRLDD